MPHTNEKIARALLEYPFWKRFLDPTKPFHEKEWALLENVYRLNCIIIWAMTDRAGNDSPTTEREEWLYRKHKEAGSWWKFTQDYLYAEYLANK